MWIVFAVVINPNANPKVFFSLLQRTQVGKDRVESATTVSGGPFLIVLIPHAVERDLVIDHSPRQQLFGNVRRQQVSIRSNVTEKSDRIFLGDFNKERTQVFHRLEAIERLTTEPSDRQVAQARCLLFN